MTTLVIDAYDSFVYVITQYLMSAGADCRVVRNDKISLEGIASLNPDNILLGPGPGHPADAHYVPIVQEFGPKIPMMGVCLGHQAIGLAFGGIVAQARHLMHGKVSAIKHDSRGLFQSCATPFIGTRYHSLIVDDADLPGCLEITARSEDDSYIMGLRHREFPMESVQFHPESIATEGGMQLIRNFLQMRAPFT